MGRAPVPASRSCARWMAAWPRASTRQLITTTATAAETPAPPIRRASRSSVRRSRTGASCARAFRAPRCAAQPRPARISVPTLTTAARAQRRAQRPKSAAQASAPARPAKPSAGPVRPTPRARPLRRIPRTVAAAATPAPEGRHARAANASAPRPSTIAAARVIPTTRATRAAAECSVPRARCRPTEWRRAAGRLPAAGSFAPAARRSAMPRPAMRRV